MKILIIDDEEKLVSPLKSVFENSRYAVDVAYDGAVGLGLARINVYDCIILDLNLPNIGGIEISKKLREDGINTPILMLTARNLKSNVWEGFENGADDYLTKPFDLKELMLRVEALIRRSQINRHEVIKMADLEIDLHKKNVKKSDQEMLLNNKEFGILEYLVRNLGKVISAEELLEHVWDSNIDSLTQTVRTNIKTLRSKIDPSKKIILTIKGRGYYVKEQS